MPYPRSDHCDGLHFHNSEGEKAPNLLEVFRWQISRLIRKKPLEPAPFQEKVWGEGAKGAGGSATFLGHASFLLQGVGWNALLDPVLSETIGPGFGLNFRRAEPAYPGWDALADPDFVMVTHNHYDHCDTPTLRRVASRPSRPVAVVPLGNGKLLSRMGFSEVVELDWWESWRSEKGPVVTLTPATHFSARGPFDRNRSLWGGFHLTDGPLSFFAAGDTGYGKHFKEIAHRLGSPKLALLPIGAHKPARLMKPIHQGPQEAIQAHHDLGAARSVAFHFGAFPLADDTLHGPAHELAKRRQAVGMTSGDFLIPRPGQVVMVG